MEVRIPDQLGYSTYSSYFTTNDENPELIHQVLSENYILVFGSPEWFDVINYLARTVRNICAFSVLFWISSPSLFFPSHLFLKGILCCVIRRSCEV